MLDYFITPADLVKLIKRLSLFQVASLLVAPILLVTLSLIVGFDLAFLVFGLVLMLGVRIRPQIPLYIAIAGLVCLMILSFFVKDGNSWEQISDTVAIGVFFLMIFGVFGLVIEQVKESRQHKASPEEDPEVMNLLHDLEELNKPQHQARPMPEPRPKPNVTGWNYPILTPNKQVVRHPARSNQVKIEAQPARPRIKNSGGRLIQG